MLHVSEPESSQETEGNVLVYSHHCLHHFLDFLGRLFVVLSLQLQFTDPNATDMAETGTFLPFE